MTRFAYRLRSLPADEHGLTTVEYTIVLCLIAALCVAAWARFGDGIDTYLGRANVKLHDHLSSAEKGPRP